MDPIFNTPRVFREREVPEGAEIAGYAALVHAYGVDAPLRSAACIRSKFSAVARRETSDWAIFEKRYRPEPTIAGHLTFALRHEPLDLLVLKRCFDKIEIADFTRIVAAEPSGIWTRRAWFLFEWLTGRHLEVPDLKRGNYIEALEPTNYYTVKSVNSPRHRVRNNLPGVPDFCPIIRRTASLDTFIGRNLDDAARQITGRVDRRVLSRAASFLLLADSQASFQIEGDRAPRNRIERWGRAVMQAGHQTLSVAELERLQSVIIEGARLIEPGIRTDAVFLGDRAPDGTPIPEFIGARPTDLARLMSGLLAANIRMSEGQMPPVLQAAAISFGFVMAHPFEDGNGRLHRFLIHHVLAERGFSPPDVLFPVSTAILAVIDEYAQVLKAHSGPLMDHIEWTTSSRLNVAVLNDTRDLYALFDATKFTEFLYTCVARTIDEDLPMEIAHLRAHDQAKSEILSRFEMPDSKVSLLITFLRQNGGILSKRRRQDEFAALTDDEVTLIEGLVQEAFDTGETTAKDEHDDINKARIG
jgi:Fic family protein